jgi:hypothetical protein
MDLPELPRDLLARLRADPARAPETIALAAAERHAPAAARWAAELRERYGLDGLELAQRAKRKHATLARVSGAATGLGGVVTMVPDLVSLVWIQTRMVFHVAAAFGYDPHDPMRPAELLVLYDVYDDPQAARAALDGAGRHLAAAYVERSLRGGGREDEQLATRLLRFAGRRAGRRLAARAIPGLAVLANAAGNERSTRALADDAIAFYGGAKAGRT